jgi:hypothetical protein
LRFSEQFYGPWFHRPADIGVVEAGGAPFAGILQMLAQFRWHHHHCASALSNTAYTRINTYVAPYSQKRILNVSAIYSRVNSAPSLDGFWAVGKISENYKNRLTCDKQEQPLN